MKNLPHKNVYTRLGISKINGVGVIALKNIKKGTNIFYGDEDSKMVWIGKEKLKNLPIEIKRLYNDFCVTKKKGNKIVYGCPLNFNMLTVAWYLNDSDKPNVYCGDDYLFYALRDIKKGEELTVNYDSYSLS